MKDSIFIKFELHRKWKETLGKEGEKLCLENIDFRNFNLLDKEFDQANLIECIFDNLKLENIDFYASLLCSSTFKNSELNRCDFYKSDLDYTDFSGAVIREVRFCKSDCTEVNFKKTIFMDCNLENTLFYLCDFTNAELNNIEIGSALFSQVILKGTILKNIKGIEEASFKSINIGTKEEPILLKEEEARKWIIENCII